MRQTLRGTKGLSKERRWRRMLSDRGGPVRGGPAAVGDAPVAGEDGGHGPGEVADAVGGGGEAVRVAAEEELHEPVVGLAEVASHEQRLQVQVAVVAAGGGVELVERPEEGGLERRGDLADVWEEGWTPRPSSVRAGASAPWPRIDRGAVIRRCRLSQF